MLIDTTWVEAPGYGSKAGVIRMKGSTGTHRYSPFTKIQRAKQGGEVLVGIKATRRQLPTRSRDQRRRALGRRNAVCDSPRNLTLMPTYVVVRYPRCMRSEKYRLGGSGV